MISRLSILITLVLNFSVVFAQVNAGPDKEICNGMTTQLEGSSSGNYSYIWTSTPFDPTISNPNILTPTVSPAQTTVYTLEGRETSNANLVTNGDFEQGNTGFISDYDYCDQQYCLEISPANGEYGINDDPSYLHEDFPSCGDHTSGSGLMMICNGDENPNSTLYQTTVNNIQTNTDYEFSAFITSMTWSIPNFGATFRFEINGTSIGTYNATSNICTWGEFSTIWNSGTSTTATIRIINTTTIPSDWGNDFALDDISLKEVIVFTDNCTVTVNEIPTSTFDLQQSACMNDTVIITYTGNPGTNASYYWDFGSDAVIVSGTNQGPFEVYWSTSGDKTISLWIDNGCISETTENTISIIDIPDIGLIADETIIQYGTKTALHGIVNSPSTYQFSWQPENMLTDPGITDPQTVNLVQDQMYYFTVTEEINSCTAIDSVLIVVDGGPLTILSLSASPDTICIGDKSYLDIAITGGSGNYNITWESTPPGFIHSGSETSIEVSPNQNTSYTAIVNDGFNPEISSEVTITVNDLTSIVTEPQDISTNPGSTITYHVDAEHAEYFQWQISIDNGTTWNNLLNNSTYSGTNTSTLTLSSVSFDMDIYQYRCIVSGDCNEVISDAALLSVIESPEFISTLERVSECQNNIFDVTLSAMNFQNIKHFKFTIEYDNNLLEFIELSNINSELANFLTDQELLNRLVFVFDSDNEVTIEDGKLFDIRLVGMDEGQSELSFQISECEVTSGSGQSLTLNLSNGSITLLPAPEPVDEILASNDTLQFYEEIDITLEAIGGSGDRLIWTKDICNGDTLYTGKTYTTFRPEQTTSYFAYWINQCGKSLCSEKKIVILFDQNVGIPNAFTPNNDGINDIFSVVSSEPLIDFKMQIYNRNATLIFETDDQNAGWNGTYMGDQLKTNSYIYYITYKVPNKYSGFDNMAKKGMVTLIR